MTIQEMIAAEADRIVEQVCKERFVSKEELLSRNKLAEFVAARRVAIRQLRTAGFNQSQIAKALHRNPASILYWSSKTYRASRLQGMRDRKREAHDHL